MKLDHDRYLEAHAVGIGLNVIRFYGKAMRIHHMLEHQHELAAEAEAEAEAEPELEGEEAHQFATSIVESMKVIKFIGKLKHRGGHKGKMARVSLETQMSMVDDQLKEAQSSGDIHAICAAMSSAYYLATKHTGAKTIGTAAAQLADEIRAVRF